MKKYLIVKADTNDADYVTKKTEIKDGEIDKYLHLISVIKSNGKSWKTGEVSDEGLEEQYPDFSLEVLESFGKLVPYGEYGVHTIESIEILEVSNEQRLL